MFTVEDFQYGTELEFGDIPKQEGIIPSELGSFEYCEGDIINLDPSRHGAAHPKGDWGGEINTVPSLSVDEQVDKIMSIIDLFEDMDCSGPTISHRAHTHIHVHIPGLIEDLDMLKRVTQYVYDNQEDFLSEVYPFDERAFDRVVAVDTIFGDIDHVTVKAQPLPSAARYLRTDGGKRMAYWVNERAQAASSFEEYIKGFCSGESRRGMPLRYGINLYCLKHTKTIEFRCFRGSLDEDEIHAAFDAVQLFLGEAVKENPRAWKDVQGRPHEIEYPPMTYDEADEQAFMNTKVKGDFISGKNRRFIEL